MGHISCHVMGPTQFASFASSEPVKQGDYRRLPPSGQALRITSPLSITKAHNLSPCIDTNTIAQRDYLQPHWWHRHSALATSSGLQPYIAAAASVCEHGTTRPKVLRLVCIPAWKQLETTAGGCTISKRLDSISEMPASKQRSRCASLKSERMCQQKNVYMDHTASSGLQDWYRMPASS